VHVLIVDDEPKTLNSLALALRDEGHHVQVARDGREALRALRNGCPVDLVVTDLLMPVLDGWLLAHTIRACAELASIPIVMMSGSMTPHSLPPRVSFLRKPCTTAAVLEIVRLHSESRASQGSEREAMALARIERRF
jgi:CheY-like chemotaxis protein